MVNFYLAALHSAVLEGVADGRQSLDRLEPRKIAFGKSPTSCLLATEFVCDALGNPEGKLDFTYDLCGE